MSKRITWLLIILLIGVFAVCAGVVLSTRMKYREEDRTYEQAAEAFVETVSAGEPGREGGEVSGSGAEYAPVEVDFQALSEAGGDIVGWIYCEDTVINYPVVQGQDNEFYLNHSYDGAAQSSGAIFLDANNSGDFSDSNTIIYGHHMKNGSMFASLGNWADQEYYEAHPVIWLLTPEQDYKIVLFSGYTTPAQSSAYIIYRGTGAELDEYVQDCLDKSDFRPEVLPESGGRYVMLSTCAYNYEDARYVLHGMLLPVERR